MVRDWSYSIVRRPSLTTSPIWWFATISARFYRHLSRTDGSTRCPRIKRCSQAEGEYCTGCIYRFAQRCLMISLICLRDSGGATMALGAGGERRAVMTAADSIGPKGPGIGIDTDRAAIGDIGDEVASV